MADAPTDDALLAAYDATYNTVRTFDRHVRALRAVVATFAPQPPAAPLPWNELRPLMVAVMETDETCGHLRGTSNWAAAIANAVIAAHGITTHKDAP